MIVGFLSFFTTCLTCLTMVTHAPLLASAMTDEPQRQTSKETPTIFPNGANSVFIGHSFFIPIAQQFNLFAESKKEEYPDHRVGGFFQPGEKGSPIYLWDNHLNDIEKLLKGNDVELFGMVTGYIVTDDGEAWSPPFEEVMNAYTQWIDLVHSYNPSTSIFIALPWPDYPSLYDPTTYMTKIQTTGDVIYDEVITTLRNMYPTTHIYYFNYGSVVGEMRNLFEQGNLFDITTVIKNWSSNQQSTIYTDTKGHAGFMLKDLASLAWLNWFYTGQDFTTFGKTVKDEYDLDWDEQNIMDIYQVVGQVNQEYRLYNDDDDDDAKDTKPPREPSNSGALTLSLNVVFSVVILVYSIIASSLYYDLCG